MISSIKIIHEIFKKMNHTRYSIIIDTEGCFPRTGHLLDSQEIEFNVGDELSLEVDQHLIGTKAKLGCNIDNLTRCVRIGDKIYLNEGKIIG
jgi:pyruvate kinase